MGKLAIYFGVVFGVLGLLISLIFSLFSQNSISVILVNMGISVIVSAILGIIVYFILKAKVPEILEVLEISPTESYSVSEEESSILDAESMDSNQEKLETHEIEAGASEEVEELPVESVNVNTNSSETKPRHFGDHILVDKIAIKNEPKLMAEAIRTMLSKEE